MGPAGRSGCRVPHPDIMRKDRLNWVLPLGLGKPHRREGGKIVGNQRKWGTPG